MSTDPYIVIHIKKTPMGEVSEHCAKRIDRLRKRYGYERVVVNTDGEEVLIHVHGARERRRGFSYRTVVEHLRRAQLQAGHAVQLRLA